MKINHIAIWVKDLERMRAFYMQSFSLFSNEKYTNPGKEFSSYFLYSDKGSTRIELMHHPGLVSVADPSADHTGWTHIAFSTGSKEAVDRLTTKLADAGCEIISEPRTTGDGYYESAVRDPEGNYIEITI